MFSTTTYLLEVYVIGCIFARAAVRVQFSKNGEVYYRKVTVRVLSSGGGGGGGRYLPSLPFIAIFLPSYLQ